ncbi:chromate transporter [Anaeromassilibacillus sp. An172]|uniref:chromate transporter n=1 Tax=Anaeromassilibacillus sp. An172 TaxID=1965570 RepID=UPI000B3672F2|nr:chromate transporter [Anaeromassilibacillus sp. An172]OUP80468.1 chromate transporter [Anaeromassilibacillus sp. An172]
MKKTKARTCWDLLCTFFKIGLFTFGGGYSMISLIDDECVVKKKWITSDELMNVTIIAESTPGPIAINCATYVGYRQAGILGSVISTIGVVLPSFIIIYIISLFFDNILENKIVASAFKGIKIAVSLLVFTAALRMLKIIPRNKLPLIIMAVTFVAMIAISVFSINFSSIYLILIAGLVGYITFAISRFRKEDKK